MNYDRDKERKAGKTFPLGMSFVALIFGIFWCLVALSMGAWFVLIFGIPFVGLLAYRLVMVAKHGKDSPGQSTLQNQDPWEEQTRSANNGWCPYCGSSVEESFAYCPKCGRKLN